MLDVFKWILLIHKDNVSKDVAVLAKSADNDGLRRSTQAHINLLSSKYKQFSDAAGLEYKAKRMSRADFRRVKTNAELTSSNKSGIINAGGISGARNPHSRKAKEHAERYYNAVRSMRTDVSQIAKSTGLSEEQIRTIKNYIFFDKHDLGGNTPELFDPDFMMAESWKRLIEGKPQPHDVTLLHHELMEQELVKQGCSQSEAHIITSKKYNYAKEAAEFYDKIKKYSD